MKKKINEKRLIIKMILCIVYLVIMTILFVCSYKMFEQKKQIIAWQDAESVEEYTYMDIYKMSEKFAFYNESNIGIHFVIEKEETGMWHTYLIAINENDYNKYKDIIDYTYERTDKVPEPIRVYGYPVIIDDEIKQLAIKNIANFVPKENEVVITQENYEAYLTNSFLDTTQEKKESFDIVMCTTLVLLLIIVILFILTIFDKDKIVDNIDEKIDSEIKKTKKVRKRK